MWMRQLTSAKRRWEQWSQSDWLDQASWQFGNGDDHQNWPLPLPRQKHHQCEAWEGWIVCAWFSEDYCLPRFPSKCYRQVIGCYTRCHYNFDVRSAAWLAAIYAHRVALPVLASLFPSFCPTSPCFLPPAQLKAIPSAKRRRSYCQLWIVMGRTHLYKDMQTRDLGETPIMETATSTHTHA